MARTVRITFVLLVAFGALVAGFSAGSSAAVRPAGRTAVVKGYVCYGRPKGQGPCHVAGVGICNNGPQSCVSADRVAAVNADGRRVATVHLHDHRFKLDLVPGRYALNLLGDGKHVHGEVMSHEKVRARAHRTVTVRFWFDFGY